MIDEVTEFRLEALAIEVIRGRLIRAHLQRYVYIECQ